MLLVLHSIADRDRESGSFNISSDHSSPARRRRTRCRGAKMLRAHQPHTHTPQPIYITIQVIHQLYLQESHDRSLSLPFHIKNPTPRTTPSTAPKPLPCNAMYTRALHLNFPNTSEQARSLFNLLRMFYAVPGNSFGQHFSFGQSF